MKVFSIKAILERSNPVEMREICIDAKRTARELCTAESAIFNSGKEPVRDQGGLYVGERSCQADQRLEELMAEGRFFYIKDSSVVRGRIRLEVMKEYEASDYKIPSVTRFRSGQRGQEPSISNFQLEYGGDDGNGRLMSKFNRSLVKIFAPDEVVPELNMEKTIPLSECIKCFTLTKLKEMAEREGFSSKLSGRKDEVVKRFAAEMSRDSYWLKTLNEMSMREYLNMKKLCTSGEREVEFGFKTWDEFPVLAANGVIVLDYSSKRYIAREFMLFYEKWLTEKKEAEYLQSKAFESTIMAATRLYGFADIGICITLMKSCYPKHYNSEREKQLWSALTKQMNERNILERITGDTWYLKGEFKRSDAEALFNRADESELYIPSKKDLERVIYEGYFFDAPIEDELEYIIYKNFNNNESELLELLAGYAYCGADANAACERIRMDYRFKTDSHGIKAIRAFWEKRERSFRRIGFGGHTQEEIEEAAKSLLPGMKSISKATPAKSEKIYPNSPCPCGSGKKYKLCCGRKL